ncbi:MAG: ornithine cyclodeaminase [Amaricoccus sp.]|uniref:ornithine cyclodeaminase family protein n=1 Tax=Amaricoccus sp. TaxID=1872485 RepID=UPI0039E27B69
MVPKLITYDDAIGRFSWPEMVEALRAGHRGPRAEVADMFLGPADATLLSRAAFIAGVGYGVKSFTVLDRNAAHGIPTVQGAMLVFEPEHGRLEAIVESRLVTELKTAADSVLGALCLARPDSSELLVVGAGTVARSLVTAYLAVFPRLERVSIWARRTEQATALCRELDGGPVPVVAVADLAEAVARAHIVSSATMARAPILHGAWVAPGTHVDLIGAYKADMREADDALIAAGALFVDCRETAIDHIGELRIPIAAGVISADAVRGDLYDLVQGKAGRASGGEITVYKNGGGAHLDLMIARQLARGG